MIRLRCSSGQAAHEAIDEAIKDGDLPKNAVVGSIRQTPGGWFDPKPEEKVLGTVTVDHKRSYHIVVNK